MSLITFFLRVTRYSRVCFAIYFGSLFSSVFSQNHYDIKDIISKNGYWYEKKSSSITNGRVYDNSKVTPLLLGNLVKGQKSGYWNIWYNNGKKRVQEYWNDGIKIEGKLKMFSRNGVQTYEKDFDAKSGTGSIKSWYVNGQKWRNEEWKNKKLIYEISWYENGAKEKVLKWDYDNYRTYEHKFWYENSKKKKEIKSKNGIIQIELCWNIYGEEIVCD